MYVLFLYVNAFFRNMLKIVFAKFYSPRACHVEYKGTKRQKKRRKKQNNRPETSLGRSSQETTLSTKTKLVNSVRGKKRGAIDFAVSTMFIFFPRFPSCYQRSARSGFDIDGRTNAAEFRSIRNWICHGVVRLSRKATIATNAVILEFILHR